MSPFPSRSCRESAYWLRLIGKAGRLPQPRSTALVDECEQLSRILDKSLVTAKSNDESDLLQFAIRDCQFAIAGLSNGNLEIEKTLSHLRGASISVRLHAPPPRLRQAAEAHQEELHENERDQRRHDGSIERAIGVQSHA